jgi:rod shape-determining protein MreC
VSLGARFALLALVSLALMLFDHQANHLARVRQALSIVVYPIQMLVDVPTDTWQSLRGWVAERDALLAENEQLKRERLSTNFRLQRLDTLEAENRRLRELLESTEALGHRVLVAEVLAVDLPYRQRFNLNRGLQDGVFVGQALLDADGVVGQVVEVAPFTSEAVLITDADHSLPVSLNRNGLRTIAFGTGDSNRLRLPYLTNSADIVAGDLLISSGIGGVFPSGYPVGRVLEVSVRPGQSFAEVIAEPVSKLDSDQEVLLVWTEDSEPLPETAHLAGEP